MRRQHRQGALAAIVVASAVLGGATALVAGKATGWLGDDETIVLSSPAAPSRVGATGPEDAFASPLPGSVFDPAAIYRERASGVVTIFALFDEIQPDAEAQGSGFVASRDGYVLTNSHVITTAGEGADAGDERAASEVFVEFLDGDRVPASVIGWDVYDDVGLIKVDPGDHPLVALPLGDSSSVVVGEPVAAIGSPFGQVSSLTVGVVSATERTISSLTSNYSLADAIQTDASLNRGNSGGPLFNRRGEVVGINAQIRSESGAAEGVGFAVPINSARRSMEQLIELGEVRYAWIGIQTRTLTPRLADKLGYETRRGAAIQEVIAGSPADEAGLRGGGAERSVEGVPFREGGDVVVSIDGQRIGSTLDLIRMVTERLLPEQEVRLEVVRGAERIVIPVVLGERPASPRSGP